MIPELRAKLLEAIKNKDNLNYHVLVVGVRLPNNRIELITNYGHEQIAEKLEYYKNAYDVEMRLNSNTKISIVDFMVI